MRALPRAAAGQHRLSSQPGQSRRDRRLLSCPGGPFAGSGPFSAVTCTLDLLIPIGAFGLRNTYASTGAPQWLAYVLIATGWILAAAVIAGITRAVRRD